MRKYLISEKGQFYKANLHCHSTFSDGKQTPEELKKLYMAHGYSIIAFTDHDVLIPHPELKDENFLPLNGLEYEINDKMLDGQEFDDIKTCHFCAIALEEDNLFQPCWHRNGYQFGGALAHRDEVKFDDSLPDYVRAYTSERITDMMLTCREKGFFVTYNHPVWSLENYNEYCSYHGMHAMEMCNYGCWIAGFDEYNPQTYDDMLRNGEKIYCIMTDDNHNINNSCGAYTMIKAEKLEYRTITKALENGDFYCSQGPEIKELWYEDGRIYITCSSAKEVTCVSGRRKIGVWRNGGSPVTEANFPVSSKDGYLRFTVTDESGLHANTNAYFVEDLLKDDK